MTPINNDPLGAAYWDHYERFLGKPIDNLVFEDPSLTWKIQILVFQNVFDNCVTFATMGLSHYAKEIGCGGELICVVDAEESYVPKLLFNTVKTIILRKMKLGWGIGITGNKDVSPEFFLKTGKNAFYITNSVPFPDRFAQIDGFGDHASSPRVYLGIFVSDKEYKFFCEIGAEKFEEYLESEKIDPFDVMRK